MLILSVGLESYYGYAHQTIPLEHLPGTTGHSGTVGHIRQAYKTSLIYNTYVDVKV